MRCPNPACPYAKKHARAAEYRAGASTCSDCGGALVDDNAEAPSSPAASSSRRAGAPLGQAPAPLTRALVAALAVSAVAVVAGPLLSLVPLPYIDVEALHAVYGGRGALTLSGESLSSLSAGAIGFAPWITGAILVELVALAVPRWRARRHGGPAGRASLARAAVVVGLAVAFLQAVLLTRWVASVSGGGGYGSYGYAFAEIAPELYGLGPQALFALTIVAGSCVLRLVVAVVERAGVGNGYALLFLGALAMWLVGAVARGASLVAQGALAPLVVLGAFVLVGAVVTAVVKIVRPVDDDGDPDFVAQPNAGIVPFDTGVGAAGLVASSAGVIGSVVRAGDLEVLAVGAVIGLVTVPMFAVLFSSPTRAARRRAMRAGRAAPNHDDREHARAAASTALKASLVLQVVLLGAWLISLRIALPLDVALIAVGTAAVLDVVAELSARRRRNDLVSVWPLHSFAHVAAALHALRDENIDVHARGAHLRALGHFFMPFVPVELLVPAADADRARGVLASLSATLSP